MSDYKSEQQQQLRYISSVLVDTLIDQYNKYIDTWQDRTDALEVLKGINKRQIERDELGFIPNHPEVDSSRSKLSIAELEKRQKREKMYLESVNDKQASLKFQQQLIKTQAIAEQRLKDVQELSLVHRNVVSVMKNLSIAESTCNGQLEDNECDDPLGK